LDGDVKLAWNRVRVVVDIDDDLAKVPVAALRVEGDHRPDAQAADGFKAWPTCNIFDKRPPRNQCRFGSGFGAVFLSNFQDRVRYKLCVDKVGGRLHFCKRKRTHQAGTPSGIKLFSRINRKGTYSLTWKHGGTVIDRDDLKMKNEAGGV
jgi:hypothetical protein